MNSTINQQYQWVITNMTASDQTHSPVCSLATFSSKSFHVHSENLLRFVLAIAVQHLTQCTVLYSFAVQKCFFLSLDTQICRFMQLTSCIKPVQLFIFILCFISLSNFCFRVGSLRGLI